ncbi:MAG: hypothetical protein KDD53_07180 [Bdellovibrionales bacterium]|nr:hypothetical protein [Bdellovibrionales bacterium]
MEQFFVLTTYSDHMVADSTCGLLEQAGIPVMLEHVEIHEAGVAASGIRLLVPFEYTQRAMKIIEAGKGLHRSDLPPNKGALLH